MADSIDDSMDNIVDQEEEMERPHTPDYHHEGNDKEDLSDISDDENSEKHEQTEEDNKNITKSPTSDAEEDKEAEEEVEKPSTPSDSEKDEDEIVNDIIENNESNDSVTNDNTNEPFDSEAVSNDNVDEEDECDKEDGENGKEESQEEISTNKSNQEDENLETVQDSIDRNEESDEEESKVIEDENAENNEDENTERNEESEDEAAVKNVGIEEPENAVSVDKSDNELEIENTSSVDTKDMSNSDRDELKNEQKEEDESAPSSPTEFDDADNKATVKEKSLDNDNSMSSLDEDIEKTEKDQDVDSQDKQEEPGNDDEEEKPDDEDDDAFEEERSEPDEAGGDQLIQDIFGASDEEEEFEGFDQDEIDISRSKDEPQSASKSMISDDEDEGVTGEVMESMVVPKPKDTSDDSDSDDDRGPTGTVWDFDIMMEQKKASRSKKRRRKGDSEFISDSDDLVVEMVKQMKQAAEEDKQLNEAKQAATKKLKLLPLILKHLNKADLQFTFIDSGILAALKDWLSPLPDGSLPHLQIRTGLLKILSSFPALDTGALKMSGLGKAVMLIYRHPKEIRQNKDRAGKLINEWARPIFGVTSNFKSMSREEREERDYQNMSKRRRLSSNDEGGKTPRSIDRALQGEKKAARPGEKGFIMRARVPTPSNKDYVVRPKSNLDALDFQRVNKSMSRADKQMRMFKDRKKSKAPTHAATISIEGRKMGL